MDDVMEWINSVWKQFLGYGAAVCTLVMLIFCMAWCFRRSAGTTGQGPRKEPPTVIYHSASRGQETTAAATSQDTCSTAVGEISKVDVATPPPCHKPTSARSTVDEDTIGNLLAKCAY